MSEEERCKQHEAMMRRLKESAAGAAVLIKDFLTTEYADDNEADQARALVDDAHEILQLQHRLSKEEWYL